MAKCFLSNRSSSNASDALKIHKNKRTYKYGQHLKDTKYATLVNRIFFIRLLAYLFTRPNFTFILYHNRKTIQENGADQNNESIDRLVDWQQKTHYTSYTNGWCHPYLRNFWKRDGIRRCSCIDMTIAQIHID